MVTERIVIIKRMEKMTAQNYINKTGKSKFTTSLNSLIPLIKKYSEVLTHKFVHNIIVIKHNKGETLLDVYTFNYSILAEVIFELIFRGVLFHTTTKQLLDAHLRFTFTRVLKHNIYIEQ